MGNEIKYLLLLGLCGNLTTYKIRKVIEDIYRVTTILQSLS